MNYCKFSFIFKYVINIWQDATKVFLMSDCYSIVIFTDIRGFTQWSENQNVYQYAPELIKKFNDLLETNFKDCFIKKLGDGAMIVCEKEPEELVDIINDVLNKIGIVTKEFDKECNAFQTRYGQKTDLKLGWGITRGTIKKTDDNDYLGSTINRAARLCDIARPFGIVIDRYNFDLSKSEYFEEYDYDIKGISEKVSCWVSKEISRAYVRREQRKECPEVHVAGICYRENNGEIEVLLSKRSDDRKIYPGLYEGCGGQLRANEVFATGVIRHYRAEMGITVSVESENPYLYTIKNGDNLINGLCFKCKYIEGEPKSQNHSQIKWIKLKDIRAISDNEIIPGIKKEISVLFDYDV